MKNKNADPHQILLAAVKKKQKRFPKYSMRALARDVKISPSFLSSILTGAKQLPLSRIGRIAEKLGMDETSEAILRRAVILNQLTSEQTLEFQKSNGKSGVDFLSEFKELDMHNTQLFQRWYYIALLDLSTCSNFKMDVPWIAKKLGLRTSQVAEALHFLISTGYLIEKDGKMIKSDELLRTPTLKSQEAIRNFHKQLMLKAIEEMLQKTSSDDFSKRWISGIIMAVDASKVAEIRKRLNVSLHEIAAFASEGQCTEVYQLGIQFYPLTKINKVRDS